jgi:hypothetical protein
MPLALAFYLCTLHESVTLYKTDIIIIKNKMAKETKAANATAPKTRTPRKIKKAQTKVASATATA